MDNWMLVFLGAGAIAVFLIAFLVARRDKRAQNTGGSSNFSQKEIADAGTKAANTDPSSVGFNSGI